MPLTISFFSLLVWSSQLKGLFPIAIIFGISLLWKERAGKSMEREEHPSIVIVQVSSYILLYVWRWNKRGKGKGKGKGRVESDWIWEINPLLAQVRLLDYFVLDRDREKARVSFYVTSFFLTHILKDVYSSFSCLPVPLLDSFMGRAGERSAMVAWRRKLPFFSLFQFSSPG